MSNKKLKFYYLSTFYLFSLLSSKAHSTVSLNQSNLEQEYELTKNFIQLDKCSSLLIAADEMIKKFYHRNNIVNHAVYHTIQEGKVDLFKGREAYNFVIHHSNKESDIRLPGLRFEDLDPTLQLVSKLIEAKLKIKKGRYILGVQRYYQESGLLPLHYDQQFLQLKIKDKDSIIVNEAIIPNRTAVLTLINNTVEGGTRISNKNKSKSIVVEYASSDLLVFNNSNILHGVDALKENSNFQPPYIRYTLSWHPIEYDCLYFNNKDETSITDITYEQAVERNYKFEKEVWPGILAAWESH